MEFNILDKSRVWIGVIDHFKSAIWTSRYYDVGDFELYVEATTINLSLLQPDFFVTREDDDMACIIEKINIVTDADGGNYIIVTGRSLSCILARRIIWTQTTLQGTVEDCIRQLISENVISPNITERKIDNFFLKEKHDFSERLEMQMTGDNLLDAVMKLCKSYEYGFKITFNDARQFIFELYDGANRSYNQTENQFVVFSPNFDNVKSVEYSSDKTGYKNVALVAGEGEGLARKTMSVGNDSGFNRREIYVDARDLSTNENEISPDEYNKLLTERGNESLVENTIVESFEGEVEPVMNYTYKTDYFLGDIIQIENEFGISAAPRILEIIECEDENGYSLTPTFSSQEG